MSESFDGTVDPEDMDSGEYALVFPFICCQSNGGPYDDAAFVAGSRFGRIDANLDIHKPALMDEYVEPDMVSQYDLLAMHHGYEIRVEPGEDWARLTFVRREA